MGAPLAPLAKSVMAAVSVRFHARPALWIAMGRASIQKRTRLIVGPQVIVKAQTMAPFVRPDRSVTEVASVPCLVKAA